MNNLFLAYETYTNGYTTEILDIILFSIFSAILLTITNKNPIVSVLFFIRTFAVIPCHLIMLGLSTKNFFSFIDNKYNNSGVDYNVNYSGGFIIVAFTSIGGLQVWGSVLLHILYTFAYSFFWIFIYIIALIGVNLFTTVIWIIPFFILPELWSMKKNLRLEKYFSTKAILNKICYLFTIGIILDMLSYVYIYTYWYYLVFMVFIYIIIIKRKCIYEKYRDFTNNKKEYFIDLFMHWFVFILVRTILVEIFLVLSYFFPNSLLDFRYIALDVLSTSLFLFIFPKLIEINLADFFDFSPPKKASLSVDINDYVAYMMSEEQIISSAKDRIYAYLKFNFQYRSDVIVEDILSEIYTNLPSNKILILDSLLGLEKLSDPQPVAFLLSNRNRIYPIPFSELRFYRSIKNASNIKLFSPMKYDLPFRDIGTYLQNLGNNLYFLAVGAYGKTGTGTVYKQLFMWDNSSVPNDILYVLIDGKWEVYDPSIDQHKLQDFHLKLGNKTVVIGKSPVKSPILEWFELNKSEAFRVPTEIVVPERTLEVCSGQMDE